MRALVWKELRENVRWMPIAAVVVAVIVWMVAPGDFQDQTLIAQQLVHLLGVALPLLAFALGVVQSYRDLQPGAGGYLAHRSVTTSDVFLAKAVAGFGIYAAAVALPLLMLAAWIALQGMAWHPMRPAQVVPALVFALAAFLMHPAAMLMMARSASWWGTRLFPVVPAAAALFPLAMTLGSGGLAGAGYAIIATLLAFAWLLASARQGWRDLAGDPPAAQTNDPLRRRWLLPSYLTLSGLVVVVAVVAMGMTMVESLTRTDPVDWRHRQLAVEAESGDLWLLTLEQEWNASRTEMATVPVGGDLVVSGKTVNPLAPLAEEHNFDHLVVLFPIDWDQRSGDGFFSGLHYTAGARNVAYAYDERGYLLGYGDRTRRWQRTVAADGVYAAGQLIGQPFSLNPFMWGWQIFSPLATAGYQLPLIDGRGVYLLEQNPPAIRKIIDQRIDAAAMFAAHERGAPRLILRSEGVLFEYRIVDASGSEAWYEKPAEGAAVVNLSRPLDAHRLTAELVRSVALPPSLLRVTMPQVAATDDGFVMVDQQRQRAYTIAADGSLATIRYEVPPDPTAPGIWDGPLRQLPIALMPGLIFVVAGAAVAWQAVASGNPPEWSDLVGQNSMQGTLAVGAFLMGLLVSLALVVAAARARDLRRGQLIAWCLAVPLLGLAAPLAILAVYRAVHCEPCPACQRPRRVDRERCRHCGADWEPPPGEGIEISDRPLSRADQLAVS